MARTAVNFTGDLTACVLLSLIQFLFPRNAKGDSQHAIPQARYSGSIQCSPGFPAHAQELAVAAERDQKEYSPYLERGYPQKVFWGDTHVHTSYSTDAGMIGNRLGPDEAYRFARGEIVVSSSGVRAIAACSRFPGGGRSRGELGPRTLDRRIQPGSS